MFQPDQCSLEALASLKLTPREAEVLLWISQGKSNHDIGVILGAKTRHHLQTRRTYFWQAQCRKSHGRCSGGARNVALRRTRI